VNPIDWKVRAGLFQRVMPHQLPLILGWDVSATVVELPSSAGGLAVGDEVYARLEVARDGAYAELVAAPVETLAKKPDSLDHVHAAAVPIAGLTAWQALFEPAAAGLRKGETILIHGAAGGVGTFAVQLAKWSGAHVIATSSGHNAAFLRELGADAVIDYGKQRFEEVTPKVDAVLDTVGGDTQARSFSVIKPGGVLVSIVGPPRADEAQRRGVRAAAMVARNDLGVLAEITRLLQDNVIRPIVAEVLPLAEARRAHQLSQGGHVRGKIVLRVAG